VVVAVLLSCVVLSLWGCLQLLRAACSDFGAVTVADAVLTFNVALGALLFLVRKRQQVWRADNPFEAIGLL